MKGKIEIRMHLQKRFPSEAGRRESYSADRCIFNDGKDAEIRLDHTSAIDFYFFRSRKL